GRLRSTAPRTCCADGNGSSFAGVSCRQSPANMSTSVEPSSDMLDHLCLAFRPTRRWILQPLTLPFVGPEINYLSVKSRHAVRPARPTGRRRLDADVAGAYSKKHVPIPAMVRSRTHCSRN